jgi:uncharacterized membrane protein
MARGKAKQPGSPPLSPSAGQGDGLRLVGAVAAIALGTALCAASGQSMLGSRIASGALASHGLMNRLDGWLGADPSSVVPGGEPALPPYASFFLILASVSVATWLAGAAWMAQRQQLSFAAAAASWGLWGWLWWLVGGSWELARLFTFAAGSEGMQQFVLSSPSFWIATGVAGWVATFFALTFRRAAVNAGMESQTAVAPAKSSGLLVPAAEDYRVPLAVGLCFAAYVVVFVAMNWQLYRSLRLPHGDSAMYEEHLWNLLHGKGFRSYLDQGIFLGEHVQVIHVLLVPLYLLWPSQLLLKLCDSLLLAACCFPVYWMARRHTGQSKPAVWLAAACLLYFPLQFLDIGIDWKTFRPNGLGIPLLLFAIDQLERRRYKTFCLLAAVALSSQEDFAIVLAPLGVWIALAMGLPRQSPALAGGDQPNRTAPVADHATDSRVNWRVFIFGAGLAVVSVVYLIVSTRVVMAYFRHGQEIHYAGYFTRFGKTLPEIAQTMLTRPALLWEALGNSHSAEYALLLLAPLGFLPLFSPGRLAVALPLFLTLCLNEVIDSPFHHVHAAAVPILLWSAAAGLGVVSRRAIRRRAVVDEPSADVDSNATTESQALWWGRFAGVSALVTGAFFGLSPLSINFWDRDSGFYWRDHYVLDKRAEVFDRVLEEIPQSARVASTDFIHPRFTHYERSYDYSDYPRAVNNYQPGVPPDTDYIVIDTHGPYSKIERPDQVPEYRDHPDQWELLPDNTDGYFIVLKRKHSVR